MKCAGRPDVILTRPDNRSERVVRCIGDLKPGATVQVEVGYENYVANLLHSLRQAYPCTRFTAEDFVSGGVRYVYIYIEHHKKEMA